MSYLPARFFTESFGLSDRSNFAELYADEKWNHAKKFLDGRRNRVSVNAVTIAAKVKEQLDVDLFPLIVPTAVKGYMDKGCACFAMCDDTGRLYLFHDRSVKYLPKKAKLSTFDQDVINETWICVD